MYRIIIILCAFVGTYTSLIDLVHDVHGNTYVDCKQSLGKTVKVYFLASNHTVYPYVKYVGGTWYTCDEKDVCDRGTKACTNCAPPENTTQVICSDSASNYTTAYDPDLEIVYDIPISYEAGTIICNFTQFGGENTTMLDSADVNVTLWRGEHTDMCYGGKSYCVQIGGILKVTPSAPINSGGEGGGSVNVTCAYGVRTSETISIPSTYHKPNVIITQAPSADVVPYTWTQIFTVVLVFTGLATILIIVGIAILYWKKDKINICYI